MTSRYALRSPRQRGYVLIEMVVSLALISLAATMATRLIIRIVETGHSLQVGEQEAIAVDRAVACLRQDVEKASTLSLANTPANVATLNLGGVIWSTESNTLVRTAGQQIDRFDGLTAAPTLAVDRGVATLRIGDADWAFAPLADATNGGAQ